ncbi:hypothetical protein BD626DRAFT_538520 [Schizophyllum amplum]|uniref:Uncharacterized protein n=1 Tax=Schizophyllum amplum TaxID=97359 RepID=A0A550C7C3_9AGAR|nr:hypothetical protein BD626DRAFT_538520 [Auriculariopsis ampla]
MLARPPAKTTSWASKHHIEVAGSAASAGGVRRRLMRPLAKSRSMTCCLVVLAMFMIETASTEDRPSLQNRQGVLRVELTRNWICSLYAVRTALKWGRSSRLVYSWVQLGDTVVWDCNPSQVAQGGLKRATTA